MKKTLITIISILATASFVNPVEKKDIVGRFRFGICKTAGDSYEFFANGKVIHDNYDVMSDKSVIYNGTWTLNSSRIQIQWGKIKEKRAVSNFIVYGRTESVYGAEYGICLEPVKSPSDKGRNCKDFRNIIYTQCM